MTAIFGQIFAYSAFSDSHFSSPGAVSGLIASTRTFRLAHPAIDAFVRVDYEHVLALVEAVHRAHFDAVHRFAPNTCLVDDVGQLSVLSAGRSGELIPGVFAGLALRLKMDAEETSVLQLDRNAEQ